MIPWVLLLLAGVLEIGWAVSLKLTDGWRNLGYLGINVSFGLAAAFCLAQAMRTIPLIVAYPVWKGLAILGLVVYETWIEKEPFNVPRAVFALLIVVGIVGLKLSTQTPAPAN